MRINTLTQRLNIIKGQIDGLSKIIDGKESCKKLIMQFSAIDSGLRKVIELYLKENLDTCLKSVDSKNRESIEDLLSELVKIK